ncbi:MAG TPA: TonB-dependent receptor [Steroidobacteraceae bacterium]|nr:TonB-dependent receptor [Steroidobacteraceae bacterium]
MGRTDARLLSVLLILFVCRIASASDASLIRFDIPAGDAQRTLLQFVAQANIEMLYSSDDVRGVITNAVSGDFTVPEALRLMIEGTGLEVSFERDFTFASIKPSRKMGRNRRQSSANEIRVKEPLDRSHFDRHFSTADRGLEEVVVTGTLLHGVGDVVSPVQVLKRDDVGRVSYASVGEMTQMLPLSSRAGPSESFQSAGNFTRGMSANLRGLGPGATLVLINGHRQAMAGNDGDFVDLSGIPWSAVNRIEVLPDGASALYGSDAIAGVVNVIMRDDPNGSETTGRLGYTSDGAPERLASQLSSWEWASGHALVAYQYNERGQLAAIDRAYAASSDKRALGGSDFRSMRASPGNVLNPTTLLPAYAIPSSGAQSVSDLIPNSVNLEDRNAVLELLPYRQSHSAYVSFSQKVGDVAEVFLESRVATRRVHQTSYPNEQNLVVPPANPYAVNPFDGLPLIVAYNFIDALGPIALKAKSLGTGTTAGTRITAGDWHIRLSGTHGTESADFSALNQPDPDRLQIALSSSDAASAFNPFGPNSQETVDSIRLKGNYASKSSLSDVTFIEDGKLWSSERAEAKLAVGAAWRNERLERNLPTSGSFSRSITSLFGELRIPIAPVVSLSESYPRLELSAAGRLEDYSDFGSATNPKLGIKWAPTREVRLRATWGTSFRAPKLVDVYDLNSSTAGLAVIPDPRSQAGVSPVLFRAGANRNLHEERATTWTAGLDFAPDAVPIRASLTYFDLVYRGRVVLPGPAVVLDILREEGQWASVVERKPSRTEIEAICADSVFHGDATQCRTIPIAAILDLRQHNMATSIARGLDLNADLRERTSLGTLAANLRIAYTLKFEQRGSDTSPSVSILDTVGNPLSLKLRAGAEWRQRPDNGWGASLGFEYEGGYRDVGSGRSVSPFKSVDVALGYATTQTQGPLSNMSLEIAVSNVFNASPPLVDREAGYDVANAAPFGRVASVVLRKRW